MDIVYAQKINLKSSLFARRVELAAPLTDIPNTYAEWQLFAPVSQRLSRFDGNMTVARGTTYDLRDAWERFIQFYGNLIEHHLGLIALRPPRRPGAGADRGGGAARRPGPADDAVWCWPSWRSWRRCCCRRSSRAKSKAQRISAVNNLKQIGLAARTWSTDNGNALPPSFEAMKNELGTDKVTYDPNTGQRFVYVGAGKSADNPEAIIAYSPSDVNGRAVLFADGSVQVMSAEKFQEALQRDAALPRVATAVSAPAHPSRVSGGSRAAPPPAAAPAAAPAATARPGGLLPPTVRRMPAAGGRRTSPRPSPKPRPQASAPSASRCRAPASPSASPKSSTPARNR